MYRYLKRKDSERDDEFQTQLKHWKKNVKSRTYEVPLESEVEAVQFGLLSKRDIEGLSAVEINQPHTQKTNVIQRNGATDARLGTAVRNMLCLTCGGSSTECGIGHSGHLQLKFPVANGEYLKLLLKILDCVCINCCRLRFPKDYPLYDQIISMTNDKERLKKLHTFCKGRPICESWADTCRRRKLVQKVRRKGETAALMEMEEPEPIPQDISVEEFLSRGNGCGTVNPSWIAEDNVFLRPVFTLTDEDKARAIPQTFTPSDMLFVLTHIPDSDVKILGLNSLYSHPSSLMWDSLYVPTISIRPSKIGRQGNNRSANEDDLTFRLKTIVRNNMLLINRIKAQEKKGGDVSVNLAKYAYGKGVYDTVEGAFSQLSGVNLKKPAMSTFTLYERLYRSVITYQNDKLKGKGVQAFGKVRSSIRTRFSGGSINGQKKNRIRGSVMGKRMDFTARTVISPNPIMHIREVEVPLMVAMHLTYPARVNRFNIHMLSDMVRRGPHEYPGARYVITTDGKMEDLDSPMRQCITLSLGMIVERHMIRGDYVLMNRQPSLHRHSIMAHRVIINPDPDVKAFGLHLAITTAYNADFDGDEMNMMLLQGEMERAEAHVLMLVDEMILKDDVALIEFVQNSRASAYIMTAEDVMISYSDACQMLMQHMQFSDRLPNSEFGAKPCYTGHEIFSCVLPRQFSMKSGDVVIEAGVMKSGRWTKSTLRNLVHVMFRDFGSTFTADFITGMYNMLNWFATSIQGFTVAMDDVYVPRHVLGLDELSKKCSEYFNQFPNHRSSSDSAVIEANLCKVADRMISVVGQRAVRYLKSQNRQNGMLDMTTSGAKGDIKNVVQVSGIIGQQYNHKSKRFPMVTCHYTNSLTDRARAHGMVYSNFTIGMDQLEFFNHLRCSRSGLVDTAVKTSRTGYMQRRIAKSLEDMVTDANGRVVNTQGEIIQEHFGFDGFSSNQLQFDKTELFTSHYKELFDPESELPLILPLREKLLESLKFHRDVSSMHLIETPIQMTRALLQVSHAVNSKEQVQIWRNCIWSSIEPFLKHNPKLCAYMMEYLSFRRLCHVNLEELYAYIHKRFSKALAPNGELIGQQAAQSIGEPFTQMTLNTFHVAGSASSLTTGVPRAEEIINTSYKTKLATPSMKIFFKQAAKTEADAIAQGTSLIFHALKDYIVMHEVNPDREPYEEYLQRETEKEEEVDNDAESPCETEDDESSDNENPPKTVFESCDTNFLVIIHVRNLVTPLSRICKRLRVYLKIDSLKWFFGPSWIGIAGSLQDPKLSSWALSMGLSGYDLSLFVEMLMEHIGGVHACGIRGIVDFAVCSMDVPEVNEDRMIESKSILYLITRGTNLKQVLQLPWVSVMHTTTNDLLEIQDLFGIDAARAAIHRELTSVMVSSGASVKHRYIALLAERMTMHGRIVPTTANGICLPGTSVLRNASFESSMDNFLIGALRGDRDPCKGMTECVVMNRELQGGTGLVDVRMDTTVIPPTQPNLKYHIPFIPKLSDAWLKTFVTPFIPIVNDPLLVSGSKGTTTSATRRRKRALQPEPSRAREPKTITRSHPKTLQKMGFSSNRFKSFGDAFIPFEYHRTTQPKNKFRPSNACFKPFEIERTK